MADNGLTFDLTSPLFERGGYMVVVLYFVMPPNDVGKYAVVNRHTNVVEYADSQLPACIEACTGMAKMLEESEKKHLFRIDNKLEV